MTTPPADGPPPHEPGYWEQQARQAQQPPQQPVPGYPPYGMPSRPDHPRATTALVLGILSVVACGVLGPFAWRIGKGAVDEIDASGGRLGGRATAQAGYVLGVVGTVFLGLAVLYLLAMAALFGFTFFVDATR
jgi:hypothetical protein